METNTKQILVYLMRFHGIKAIPLSNNCGKVELVDGQLKYNHGYGRYYTNDSYAYEDALKSIDDVLKLKEIINQPTKQVVVKHYKHDEWEYADADGVVRHHVYPTTVDDIEEYTIEGTFDEIFEKVERINDRLRYCNGTYHHFKDDFVKKMHSLWYKLIPSERSFDIFYGDGIVD